MKKPLPNLLLRDKGEFTKFQILLEVMRNQPHVKQKDISETMGITIQAISKYFKKLSKEGLLEAGSERADYRLTQKGIIKLREELKNLDSYVKSIKNELKVDHAWIALATLPVKVNEQVGLITKGGIFYTVSVTDPDVEAVGIATNDAEAGEDIGLKDLKGKIKLRQGRILIVKLPSIRQGGSRTVDIVKITELINDFKPDRIGVMGAVGRAVANKLSLKADIEFGISHAAVIAASRGLNVLVLVVGRMVNKMIQEIDSQNMHFARDIIYEVKDAKTV
ncbi:MAG: winged helix-turn-helix transcriptional regulator [Candidatus Bathyarchaeota archaeon]|nr:winged helix-turn-helix transcriptional regulator [Candidatus Termiticorpusculum sp.]MCL2868359.1 winged helix-turn-helix transcriptional regulator [Candidatus Termiticorpusculum sp.]